MSTNPNRHLSFLFVILCFVASASIVVGSDLSDTAAPSGGSLPTDCFRSRASGDWATLATWESSTNCTFSDAVISTLVPASTAAAVNIQTGHTVTLSSPQSASNLTIVGTLSAGSSTLSVTGTWTNSGTFTPGTGTVVFSGSSDQTITGNATQSFNSFTLNKAGGTLGVGSGVTTISLTGSMLLSAGNFAATGKSVQVTGDWTNNGATYTGSVIFVGPHHLLNGSATTQTFTGMGLQTNGSLAPALTGGGSLSTLNVTGDVGLNATFVAGSIQNWNISGSLSGSGGSFSPGSSTVTFNGTSQSIGGFGAAPTFNNLRVDNTLLALNSSISVAGVLDLKNGVINTSFRSLTVMETGSTTRTNGRVIEKMLYNIPGPGTFLFPVGTANGYSPVTMNVSAVTTSPVLTGATAAEGRSTASGVPADAINRAWFVSFGAGLVTDLTFGYLPGDVPAGGNEPGYTVIKTDVSPVIKYPVDCSAAPAQGTACVTPATHTAKVIGVNPTGSWTVGAAGVTTAGAVSISGRVLGLAGRGATNATVTISDTRGIERSVTTNRRGEFLIQDIRAGETYIVTIRAVRFRYAPRTISISDNMADLEFTPLTQP